MSERPAGYDAAAADQVFPGWTDEQWAEIEAAVRAIRPSGTLPEDFRDEVWLLTLDTFGLDPKTMIDGFTPLRDELREIASTIERLDALLAPRAADFWIEEGREQRDPLWQDYAGARPRLVRIAKNARARAQQLDEQLSEQQKRRTDTSNAKNWYRDGLFANVARLWESCGGEVRQTQVYRRFFEAVVRPIYFSAYGRARGLVGWPDVDWSEENSIFREHARRHMKMRRAEREEASEREMGNRTGRRGS